jgi:Xaa-Pro dipeptidase
MVEERLLRLEQRQRAADIDCVALVPGPNMRYLSGISLFTSERPIVAFYPLQGSPAVLLPALEAGRVRDLVGSTVDLYPYTDEEGYRPAFGRAVAALALEGKRCAVEYLFMRVLELRALKRAAPTAEYVSLEEELHGLRTIKDANEISAIRHAIAITEIALHHLISQPVLGMTERQIAGRLEQEMMAAGADGIAFIIVVTGPNSANPHAGPSDRPAQVGDLITVDCGVTKDGYLSDITRTFAVSEVNPRLADVYRTVKRANQAGRDAIRPGVAAQEVDRAARAVIAEAGYGEFFIHRTGHGLGMEGHEPPYIVEGNLRALEPGMVFTVEPGVYIPDVGGVRIEDNVVVTEMGSDCLTSFSRELMVI